VVAQELYVCTINENLSGGLLLHVLLATERGEAPVLGDDDLLASWELVLGAAESLESDGAVWQTVSCWIDFRNRIRLTSITSADTQDDLADVDTGNTSVWLSPSTTHTSLKSIGTGARQHLVDTDDVEWMGADTEMEVILSAGLDHVLVGTNTGSLEGLRAQLLILVGNQVDAERELVNVGLLATEIEDANLWVWDTTVEAGLWVRL